MKYLNIVAPTIKSGGGLELLLYLIEYLQINYSDVQLNIYIDKNVHINESKKTNIIRIQSKLDKFLLFGKKFTHVLYFGNLPPFRKSDYSAVYFHNRYLLLSPSQLIGLENSKLINKLKNLFRQMYIRIFINNVDFVACQNKKVHDQFIAKYDYDDVDILPFFRSCPPPLKSINKKFDFCYISLAHPHKNHMNLLEAFEILSNEDVGLNIALTVEKEKTVLIEKINNINKKGTVSIANFGIVPKEDVCKIYSQSNCLIFPSTSESFGLPLVEAVKLGLDVIASNLDFTYEVIEPSYAFDPYSSVDIADKIKQYLTDSTKKSHCKVDNKIENLIKNLLMEPYEI